MISLTVTKAPCICTELADGTVNCSQECIAGPSISDEMIETDAVATARATQFILENYSDRINTTGNMPLSSYATHKPGAILMYTDIEKGDFPSLVTSSEIVIKKSGSEYTANLNIQMEREV